MKEIIFLFVLFVANVIQAITGFAGTVLAFVPDAQCEIFRVSVEAVLGNGCCHELHIR
mgnify:CR=1 FL=1